MNKIEEFYSNFKVKDYVEDNFKNIYKNVIDCSLGVNPFERKRKNIICFLEKVNEYPSIDYKELKKILLKKYITINTTLNKENIAFGQGSMGIIRNIFYFLLQPDDIVLGYSPQFPRVISEIELKKAKYEYYSLSEKNNFKFIVDLFIEKINKDIKVIYIDNPNNPTGQIISINDIRRVIEIAKRYNTYVIIDEAYGDYMEEKNSAISLMNSYSNLIVIRSASKFYGLPDCRIGYLFADRSFINIYNNISLPFSLSNFSILLFKKRINKDKTSYFYKKKTKKVKEKIINNLNNSNYLYTDFDTPILTVKSEKYANLYQELLKNGLLSEDCSQYINLSGKYARIRINKRYKKIVKILTKVL